MAVTLLRVLLLGAIAAAADDVPVTWRRSPPTLVQCNVPDPESILFRRPPPPLDSSERPRPKPYLWRRGDEELKRASNGTLEVSRRNSEGVYQCAVRHHGGLVLGYPFNLKFAYLDKQFSTHPANATARTGQPFVLTCNITSGPAAAITWLRDGEPIPNDNRYHLLNMNNQLLITDVKKEDAGLYRCKAVNNVAVKTRMSHEGQLQVEEYHEDLNISMLPLLVETDIYAAKDSRVVLPCPLVGWPKPKMIWEHTPTVGRIAELEDEDEILVLQNLDLDQEGIYTCTVAGNSDLVKTFKVTMTKPVVITAPPTSKQTVRATTIRFNCTAVGTPAPTITWYKNGKRLESERVAMMSSPDSKRIELLIRSVTSSDGGVYQCFASNGVNSASAWASLEVFGATVAAPSGARCLPAGATAVHVRWPPLAANVFAYHVQTTKTGDKSLPGQPTQDTEDNITVQALTPYTFQVRAFITLPVTNKTVATDMSESVICQGQGVPIKMAKFDDNAVLVSWKEFVTANPGVVQWILQYKTENSSEEHNITLDGSVYNYTLEESEEPLQVRVLGSRTFEWLHQNLSLVPWTSTSVASHHLDGEVTAVPEDVEVTELSSRQFTVRWRCEEADGFSNQIYSYLICTRRVDGDEECVESSSYSVTVRNLQPNTEYVVRVQACIPGRSDGGEFSAPLRIKTPIEGPQRFSNLMYKFINASMVRVSWNSTPDKYVVRYSNEPKLPIAQWASVETFGNTVLISGVDLTKELCVRVEGNEPFGYSSIMTIPVQVPEAKDLKYSYTSSGVFVTWTGPGPRVVRYSQNLTQPLEKWPMISVNDCSVEITGLVSSNSTYVMVATPGPSQRNQVLTIPPQPINNITFYIGIGIFVGIIVLCLVAVTAVCIWKRRKRARSPIRSRRRNLSPNEGTEEEGSEMRNVGGRLANGGGSKDAGEPLLNGHVHITENPTVQQAKTPNGRMRKGRHYEPAFDVSRYEDPDTTLETVLDADTSASTTYNLLDTSRRPEYEVSRSSRDVSVNNSFNKLPDDNMNSELTRSTDFELDNSKIQPTLQPNG